MAEGSRSHICQRTVGETSLPGQGPVTLLNRPVRTRMPGGVGRGGEKPPLTRLGNLSLQSSSLYDFHELLWILNSEADAYLLGSQTECENAASFWSAPIFWEPSREITSTPQSPFAIR
jgi:hypothetical protein